MNLADDWNATLTISGPWADLSYGETWALGRSKDGSQENVESESRPYCRAFSTPSRGIALEKLRRKEIGGLKEENSQYSVLADVLVGLLITQDPCVTRTLHSPRRRPRDKTRFMHVMQATHPNLMTGVSKSLLLFTNTSLKFLNADDCCKAIS